MPFASTLRRRTAACLIALLGVLGTGLPSHHHESSVAAQQAEHNVMSADHHAHGALLVEQAERVQSNAPQLRSAPVQFDDFVLPVAVPIARTFDQPVRPLQRAPPPGAPRAPPLAA